MTTIVVGYDATPASEPALAAALREAASTGAGLRVVTVWRTAPYVGSVPGYGYDVLPPAEDLGRQLTTAAQSAVARLGSPDVEVSYDVGPGDPGTQLVAASTTADLLVLGTRRHGALLSALVGSATNYVLHHAQCPVLVVGPDAPVAWDRVVVGVDGSDCSLGALRWGAARAEAAGCPLLVVNAWEVAASPDAFGALAPDVSLYDKQVEAWLGEVVDLVLGARARVELRPVRATAAHALVDAAGPGDLLVVGSRGRSGFADLVLGSVTMSVVHHAHCSVAILRTGTGPTP